MTVVTATPIPFKHQDFSGILSFLQSPYDNVVARNRLDESLRDWPKLLNPYEVDSNGNLVRPQDERYQFTSAAFDYFYCNVKTDFTDVGPALAKLWAKFMIRRDFSSSEVIDPLRTIHYIGSSMPRSHRFNMKLKNKPGYQTLHDYLIKKHLSNNVMPDPNNPSTMILNGKSSRILNFAAISPLLLLAKDVHKAKVKATKPTVAHGSHMTLEDSDSESDTDDDVGDSDEEPGRSDFASDEEEDRDVRVQPRKKRQKMVESLHAKEYRDHFTNGNDKAFMMKLMVDIYDNAQIEMGSSMQHSIFGQQHPKDMTAKALAAVFIQSSARLCAMFAAIADQLDNREEKALIFANNPWEEMLYVVLLRIYNVKADAILATMNNEDKQKVVEQFQKPLERWTRPGFKGVAPSDLEALVLSYHMNSGLNLHYHCHNLHAPSPPPSYSIWIQSCGRIIRFGQEFECVIIQYIVEGTYNTTQMATVMKNALASISALMCKQDAFGTEVDQPLTRINTQALKHLHGYRGTLIDDRNPLFRLAEAAGDVDFTLDDKTKFVRVLNTVLGFSIRVEGEVSSNSEYRFQADADLFSTFDVVENTTRTPKAKSTIDSLPVPPKGRKNTTLPSNKGSDSDDGFELPTDRTPLVLPAKLVAEAKKDGKAVSKTKAGEKRKRGGDSDPNLVGSSAPSSPANPSKRPHRQAAEAANKAIEYLTVSDDEGPLDLSPAKRRKNKANPTPKPKRGGGKSGGKNGGKAKGKP